MLQEGTAGDSPPAPHHLPTSQRGTGTKPRPHCPLLSAAAPRSLQLAQEAQQGPVEVLRLVHVAGMASTRQHKHAVLGEMLEALQGLLAQAGVTLTIQDQGGRLKKRRERISERWDVNPSPISTSVKLQESWEHSIRHPAGLTWTCWYCTALYSRVPTGAMGTKPASCSPCARRKGRAKRPLMDGLMRTGLCRPSCRTTRCRKAARPRCVATEPATGESP